MPSKWRSSRSVTAQSKDRSRVKGKGSREKRRAKRLSGTPLGGLPPVPASLIHSRALRPTSPGAHLTGVTLRPRSRSLPVPVLDSSTTLLDRKRLRRQTLAPNESISRALFAEDTKVLQRTEVKDFQSDIPSITKGKSAGEKENKINSEPLSPKGSLLDIELKTPDFGPSSQTISLPPCVIPESKASSDGLLGGHELRFGESPNDSEVIGTSKFDVLLPFASSPRRFIGVDIDETIIATNHSPSLLLTSVGISAFQQYVHKRFTDFKTKNQLCRELEKALKDKVLVEPSISSVIRDLQDSGCLVFGVTARYYEMAASTERTLSALGVNLSLTAPFPRKVLRDPKTGAMLANGVIYCNGLSKGMVVNRFFENVVFRGLLTPSEGKPTKGLPESFIFIDDQRSQLDCILKEFHVARNLNLPVTCYHYAPDTLRDVCADLDEGVRSQILLKQMEAFVQKRIILTNKETLHLLRVASSAPLVSKDSSEKALKAERGTGVASPSTALGKLSMWGELDISCRPRVQEAKVSV